MAMERDHGIDRDRDGESFVEPGNASVSDAEARPIVRYAQHDRAMKAARGVMAKYSGVLRELAK